MPKAACHSDSKCNLFLPVSYTHLLNCILFRLLNRHKLSSDPWNVPHIFVLLFYFTFYFWMRRTAPCVARDDINGRVIIEFSTLAKLQRSSSVQLSERNWRFSASSGLNWESSSLWKPSNITALWYRGVKGEPSGSRTLKPPLGSKIVAVGRVIRRWGA